MFLCICIPCAHLWENNGSHLEKHSFPHGFTIKQKEVGFAVSCSGCLMIYTKLRGGKFDQSFLRSQLRQYNVQWPLQFCHSALCLIQHGALLYSACLDLVPMSSLFQVAFLQYRNLIQSANRGWHCKCRTRRLLVKAGNQSKVDQIFLNLTTSNKQSVLTTEWLDPHIWPQRLNSKKPKCL